MSEKNCLETYSGCDYQDNPGALMKIDCDSPRIEILEPGVAD